MMQEKWFVHFRGHTMGPFSADDIKTSIQKKELGKADRIASTEKKTWQTVDAIPEFRDFFLPPLAPSFSAPIPPPVFGKKTKKPENSIPPPVTAILEKPTTFKSKKIAKAKRTFAKKKSKPKPNKSKLPEIQAEPIASDEQDLKPSAKEVETKSEQIISTFFKPNETTETIPKQIVITPEAKVEVATTPDRKIEIRLVVPNFSKQQILFISASLFFLIVLSGLTLQYFSQRKGVKEFSTPPPPASSMEEVPERNAPIPSLKPPTRPNRE